MFDPDAIAAILHAAAREGRPVSYSELLGELGHRFTRPKMRALCRVLEHVDAAERGAGRPDLAVLVVRESDRLPGQGWWVAESATGLDYDGLWQGPAAAAYIRARHKAVFDFWRGA